MTECYLLPRSTLVISGNSFYPTSCWDLSDSAEKFVNENFMRYALSLTRRTHWLNCVAWLQLCHMPRQPSTVGLTIEESPPPPTLPTMPEGIIIDVDLPRKTPAHPLGCDTAWARRTLP